MSEPTARHRVAILTLVFTDLADSTALKTSLGDGPVRELIARHRGHVSRLALECSGRVIDWAGDGCFLTFETSSAAVMFALRVQQAHAEESDLPRVRIGVHMGEVTEQTNSGFEGGRPSIEGLSVDVAARICSLARPGQVLLSASVYNSSRQRLGVESLGRPVLWRLHGNYALKGLDTNLEIGEAALEGIAKLEAPKASEKARPVVARRAWWQLPGIAAAFGVVIAGLYFALVPRPESTPGRQYANLSLPNTIDSLAVLPLANLSGDPAQDYFADGMTEAITAELAKIGALKVVSRTSVMRYKNTQLSMPEIARELNVKGLVEGSAQRDGDQVRITVQLIDGARDVHLWTESYTNTLTSVLALQSEVALAIAKAVEAELTGDEQARIASSREVNPQAYDEYLLALQARALGTPQGVMDAVGHLTRATLLDPGFAEAWSFLATTRILLTGSGQIPPERILARSRSDALKGLEIDPNLSLVHLALGVIAFFYDWQWQEAEARFDRALELDPNNAYSRMFVGMFLANLGRYPEALEQATKSLELDPTNPWIVRTNLMTLLIAGRADEALPRAQTLLAAQPDFAPARFTLAIAYSILGEDEKGYETLRGLLDLGAADPSPYLTQVNVAIAEARMKHPERARELLEGAIAKAEYLEAAIVARAYVALGDLDSAFEWIEKGKSARSVLLSSLRVAPYGAGEMEDPNWIRFRKDPRFRQFVEALRFPPLPPEHPGYTEERDWDLR